jgi:hypothetical protein
MNDSDAIRLHAEIAALEIALAEKNRGSLNRRRLLLVVVRLQRESTIIRRRKRKSRCSVRCFGAERMFTRNALKAKRRGSPATSRCVEMNGLKASAKNPE